MTRGFSIFADICKAYDVPADELEKVITLHIALIERENAEKRTREFTVRR